MSSQVFKPYNQARINLLPPSTEEIIEAKHPARIVNEVIEKIDIKTLLKEYKEASRAAINLRCY